jgi:hypothetical protein
VSEEEYIGIVGEIFDGYTEFEYFGSTVYLKHFSIRDQRYIHRYYQKYKSIAISKGIPSEEEMLLQLKQDNLWSDKEEDAIAALNLELDSLLQTQKKMALPSKKQALQKQIDDKRNELNKLVLTKRNVVGKTAEDYASSRANEEFIRYIIYKDKELTQHYFTDEEFADLSDNEIEPLLKEHKICGERLNEDNIQHVVLRDFFNMYISQTEDASIFYGKPIIQLSAYQLKLALYARIFFNIFQYNDDMPDHIKKDPSAILNFSENKRNKTSTNNFVNKDSVATALFGATKEDLEFIDPDAKSLKLEDEIKKQGGSMNMEQLMELMGH